MAKKVRLEEGSWFEVPLSDGQFIAGMLARISPQGQQIGLGYFFDEIFSSKPPLEVLCDRRAVDAREAVRFSTLSLIKGHWAVLGRCASWNRSEWPMPSFVRQPSPTVAAFEVQFDDDDPLKVIASHRISGEVDKQLRTESIYGFEGIRIHMERLIKQGGK